MECRLANHEDHPFSITASAPRPTASRGRQAVYVWKGAEQYKNDILKLYQKKLAARGIKDTKIFVAQLIQENGALDPLRIGDNGKSFGLMQYNAHAKHGIPAKKFLAKYPEWKSIDKQLEWMADDVANKLNIYQSPKLAVISHNCPLCARHRVDACVAGGKRLKVCYYQAVTKRLPLLTSL